MTSTLALLCPRAHPGARSEPLPSVIPPGQGTYPHQAFEIPSSQNSPWKRPLAGTSHATQYLPTAGFLAPVCSSETLRASAFGFNPPRAPLYASGGRFNRIRAGSLLLRGRSSPNLNVCFVEGANVRKWMQCRATRRVHFSRSCQRYAHK